MIIQNWNLKTLTAFQVLELNRGLNY